MRRLAAVVFTSLCVASTAHAQDRLFQNSWFWGVHGGTTSVGTLAGSHGHAGTLGADWFITRTLGGLYVNFDQANFTRTTIVPDANASNGIRSVRLHDLRTLSLAGVAYPKSFGRLRPYAGLGLAFELLGKATPLVDPATEAGQTSPTVADGVLNIINNARSQTNVYLLGGAQWQVERTALFGQISVVPSSDDFLLNNTVTNVSFGVRYNFGSSIDK